MHLHATHHRSGPTTRRNGTRRPFHRDWRAWTTLLVSIGGLAVVLPFTQGLDRILFAAGLGSLSIATYARWRGAADIPTLTAARVAQLTSGLQGLPRKTPAELAPQPSVQVTGHGRAHLDPSQAGSTDADSWP